MVAKPTYFSRAGRPYSDLTLTILDFVKRQEPILLLKYDSREEAKKAYHSATMVIRYQKLNLKTQIHWNEILIEKIITMDGDNG